MTRARLPALHLSGRVHLLALGALLSAAGAAGLTRLDAAGRAADAAAPDAVARLAAPAALPPSAARLHDLGVAAAEDAPVSLWAWSRAQQLQPRAADLAHHLGEARAALDPAPPPPPPFAPGWTVAISPEELGALAALLWWVALAFLLPGPAREAPDARARTHATLTLVAALVSAVALHGLLTRPELGVLATEAAVRELPLPTETPAHTLPAGTELVLEATRGGFTRARDGLGRVGWVPTAALVGAPSPAP